MNPWKWEIKARLIGKHQLWDLKRPWQYPKWGLWSPCWARFYFSPVQHLKGAIQDLLKEGKINAAKKQNPPLVCEYRHSKDQTLWQWAQWEWLQWRIETCRQIEAHFSAWVPEKEKPVYARKKIYIVAMETLKFSNTSCHWLTVTVCRLHCSLVCCHSNMIYVCTAAMHVIIKRDGVITVCLIFTGWC